jgi:hypothetical protein
VNVARGAVDGVLKGVEADALDPQCVGPRLKAPLEHAFSTHFTIDEDGSGLVCGSDTDFAASAFRGRRRCRRGARCHLGEGRRSVQAAQGGDPK